MRRVAAILALSAAGVAAQAGVTFHQPLRAISATTLVDGVSRTQTSISLDAFDATVVQTAPATVGGQIIDTGATAAISCTFDPTGVRSRTRLQGHGVAAAAAIAGSLIDVVVVVDAPQPWRIHSSALVFSPAGQSRLNLSLSDQGDGRVVFATSGGNSGAGRLDSSGVLMPGSYRFVYDAQLVAEATGSDRDFDLRFEVPCPADTDNGSATGTSDGGVDVNDLLYFIGQYVLGAHDADIDDGSGTGMPDGAVNIDDLLFFLDRYESGC